MSNLNTNAIVLEANDRLGDGSEPTIIKADNTVYKCLDSANFAGCKIWQKQAKTFGEIQNEVHTLRSIQNMQVLNPQDTTSLNIFVGIIAIVLLLMLFRIIKV